MSAIDLRALVRDIAEAAAKCVGASDCDSPRVATYRQGASAAVQIVAEAGEWRAEGHAVGAEGDALSAAAVLALRDLVQHQRDKRARMLAADDAALRVIHGARVYTRDVVREACDAFCEREGIADRDAFFAHEVVVITDGNPEDIGPWDAYAMENGFSDQLRVACDAILRRRAAEAPQGGGRLVLPADVADGAVTVRAPGREP